MFFNRNFLLISGFSAITMFVVSAYAATPFSEYGLIQNVQDYSSNPFYNSDTATITTPKIIYATGPSLKAGDCERVVQMLIESECLQRNGCQNTQLSDIRPNVMIKLSTLPGYTYATSCSGYIDTIYESYVKSHKNTNVVNIGTLATNTSTKSNLPAWKVEYNNRADELKALQAQTAIDTKLVATAFPKTFENLSFSQQKAIKAEGYAPYQNSGPFVPLDIERTENAYVSIPELLKDDEKLIKDCINALDKQLTKLQKEFNEKRDKKNKMDADGVPMSSPDYILLEKEVAEIYCSRIPKLLVQIQNAPCSCSLNHRFRDEYLQSRNITCSTTDPAVIPSNPQPEIPGDPTKPDDYCKHYGYST